MRVLILIKIPLFVKRLFPMSVQFQAKLFNTRNDVLHFLPPSDIHPPNARHAAAVQRRS